MAIYKTLKINIVAQYSVEPEILRSVQYQTNIQY